jgi:hypothetical protein
MTVPVTTDAAGAATVYSKQFSGIVQEIQYIKTDYDAGVDFNIILESGLNELWIESNVDASATNRPRELVQTGRGVDTVYYDQIVAAVDRVKIVIAAGGNAKTGTFVIKVI